MTPEDNRKEIVTPENVRLTFIIPEPSTRLAALLFDMAIVWAISGLVYLLAWLVLSGAALWALFFTFSFFFRLGYFIYYENKISHDTPGKRKLGLRVISSTGLPVTTQSILIRNLAREIEISMPLQFVIPIFGFNTIAIGFFSLWVIAIGFTAYTNQDKMRIGDLLAGTVVIKIENIAILDDNYREDQSTVFSEIQLSYYGIYELQKLASVLEETPTPSRDEKIMKVAEIIQEKIKWAGAPVDPKTFLQEFYSVQRNYLEQKLQFGNIKENKYS